MKKQALFLMAGAIVAFASCNTATNEGTSEAQIDSMVNARVEEIRLEMMAQNDSLINAMAQMKADSIIAAMKGGKKVTTKTTTTRTTTVNGNSETTTSKSASGGGLKSHSDQNRVNDKNTVQGGGLKSQSDQNRTTNPNSKASGGLKTQSDQNKNK